MSQNEDISSNNDGNTPPLSNANDNQEYELMAEIEQLESLREQMDEVGFSTFAQIEAALKLTENETKTTDELVERRALLLEIRDAMLELEVSSYAEINNQITALHHELDQLEGFDPNNIK